MPATRRASKSPARERPGAATPPKKKAKSVTWNVEQSPLMVVINNYLVPVLIMISTPYLAYIVTYITDMEEPTLTKFMNKIYTEGGLSVNAEILKVLQPTAEAATLLLVFNFVALLIYWWPGKTEYGPVTINGHQPEYADNGVAHSVLFTLSFLAGSDLFLGWYKVRHASRTVGPGRGTHSRPCACTALGPLRPLPRDHRRAQLLRPRLLRLPVRKGPLLPVGAGLGHLGPRAMLRLLLGHGAVPARRRRRSASERARSGQPGPSRPPSCRLCLSTTERGVSSLHLSCGPGIGVRLRARVRAGMRLRAAAHHEFLTIQPPTCPCSVSNVSE